MLERFRRIVTYHELLIGMTRKELKVKYKNSVLGFAWSMLNPLLYLVVFYVVFEMILEDRASRTSRSSCSRACSCGTSSRPALGAAYSSVVGNAGIVKKVAFPREILPLAAVGGVLVHFFLQSLVLFVILAVIRWHVAWSYVRAAPARARRAAAPHAARSASCCRAINVYLRDTQHLLEVALLAWFWLTPIVYRFMTDRPTAGGVVPMLYLLNPVTPIVLIFQRALYARTISPKSPTTAADPTANQILPHWAPRRGYLRVPGLLVRDRFHPARVAIAVFGRLEGELRRGAVSRDRPPSRSATSPSTSGSTTSSTRR